MSWERMGDGEERAKHDGLAACCRRAKAEVAMVHWLATREAGRRARGMALLMAVATRDWAREALMCIARGHGRANGHSETRWTP